MTTEPQTAADFWEPFYAEGHSRWSGRPNGALVEEVADLEPGVALDLGCGGGADAIWLAARGWRVTAVDVSASALASAARAAAAAGVGDAVAWERHDLAASFPAGRFDLVAATYLHAPPDVLLPRARILRAAADAVAAGGTLLVIGHAPSPEHPHADLPGPQDVVDELALPPDDWTLVTSALRTREHAFAGEAPRTRVDAVVRLRHERHDVEEAQPAPLTT